MNCWFCLSLPTGKVAGAHHNAQCSPRRLAVTGSGHGVQFSAVVDDKGIRILCCKGSFPNNSFAGLILQTTWHSLCSLEPGTCDFTSHPFVRWLSIHHCARLCLLNAPFGDAAMRKTSNTLTPPCARCSRLLMWMATVLCLRVCWHL